MSKQVTDDPIELFRNENDRKKYKPFPEAGGVNDQKTPVEPIVEVGKVKDLWYHEVNIQE